MKVAVIFSDDIKQIVLTPENKDEKFALSLITADDSIELALKSGDVYNYPAGESVPFTGSISECARDYLRFYENSSDSRILVLRPKKTK